MASTTGLDVAKIKKNVLAYWMQGKLNWPVKVISAARASSMGATPGAVRPVRGCVVSTKFVRGRSLGLAEQILGLKPGELAMGAALLRLNRLPNANEFDLAGYTNVAACPGYPPGLGSNQWVLTADIPATVEKIAGPGQTL